MRPSTSAQRRSSSYLYLQMAVHISSARSETVWIWENWRSSKLHTVLGQLPSSASPWEHHLHAGARLGGLS
jgi:hypothetical protein